MSEALPPTQLPPSGDPNTVWILDISAYIFRAYHALPPLSNSQGEPTHAVSGVIQMLERLIERHKPTWLIVAMDPKGGSFRNDLYEKYKANRPPAPPDLSQQITRIRQVVHAWGMTVLEQPKMEADDLIATATKKAYAAGLHTVIVSADKDLLQLVGDRVVMYDTMRERIFGVPETIERMGVPPSKICDLLALIGDASDNIPGVPSIGPKTGAKLLAEWGDFDGIFSNLEKIASKGTREKLSLHIDEANLSRELVTLKIDENLELDWKNIQYKGPKVSELKKLFHELELTRALSRLGSESVEQHVSYLHLQKTDDFKKIIDNIRESGACAVFAIWDGEHAQKSQLIGLSLSWAQGHACYISIDQSSQTETNNLQNEMIENIRPLIENSLFPKYAMDAKDLILIFKNMGIHARGFVSDVSLASFLLEPDRGSLDFEIIVSEELGNEIATDESLKGKGRLQKLWNEVEGEKVVNFANQHADYVFRLAQVFEERMNHGSFPSIYREMEIPLIHILSVMEQTGICVDSKKLKDMSHEVQNELNRIEQECFSIVGHSFNVNSPKQLETILFDELQLPVIKKTKTGRSTDHTVLEDLIDMHELPRLILEQRMLAKLQGTYLEALPEEIDSNTGRIHTHFDQKGAATGRISSKDPNLQNIPIRTEIGRRIRDAFIPQSGWLMMSADYSQIELRVLAHLSQDKELCDTYSRGDDVHIRTAAAIFGVSPADVTREQRAQAKTVNFAVIYGQTDFALARNLKIDRNQAKKYIEAFFIRYSGVKQFLDIVVQHAHETGYVTTLWGRRRAVADIRSPNHHLRMAAERVARNTPIQGTAADILKRAMIDAYHAMEKNSVQSKMLLTVHDELVFEVPPDEKEMMEALVCTSMRDAAQLSVPLEVSVGWGDSWGTAH